MFMVCLNDKNDIEDDNINYNILSLNYMSHDIKHFNTQCV